MVFKEEGLIGRYERLDGVESHYLLDIFWQNPIGVDNRCEPEPELQDDAGELAHVPEEDI